MEVPFTIRKLSPWTVCDRPVDFFPYGNVIEKSKGRNQCLIYDSNDSFTNYFQPVFCDNLGIDEHVEQVRRQEQVKTMLEERRQLETQTDNSHHPQYRVPQIRRHTPSS